MNNDRNKLRKLRCGIPPHQSVTIGSGDNELKVVVVLLSTDEMQEIEEMTEEYCKANEKKVSNRVRNRYYNKLLCLRCMRDPEDPTYKTPISDDPEEVGEYMDDEDIKKVCQAYREVAVNKAPKMEILKQEDYDLLKKYLEVTPLSDLSTVLLVHLKSCHQTIVSVL